MLFCLFKIFRRISGVTIETMRPWAFWRRTQYLTGLFLLFSLIAGWIYFANFYEAASCFDRNKNGDERGVDCGGSCARVCSIDVIQPQILWTQSFKILDGQYNAVAYLENKNVNVGTPEMIYTFRLYDKQGLIAERVGSTILPPDSVYPIFEGRIDTDGRVPVRTEIEVKEIELWLNAETGREQFVVEERVLKNADTKPRLDATITNTALTQARDVEVVATIFDRNGNPLTSSRTVIPNFRERTTEDLVFTWPLPISTTVRSCEVPTDVMLAIDLSGSMNDDGGNPPEPISSVLSAAGSFVTSLKDDDSVGLVTYATNAKLEQILTRSKENVAAVIRSLTIAPESEVGSTNTGDAIVIGGTELNSGRHNSDARRVFILLTDGLANAPDEDPEQYALDAAEDLKSTGAEVYTIGLGDNVNETFLQSIASDNRNYYKAPTVATVGRIYGEITESICEDGAAVIEIIPKTEASFAPLR